MENYPLVNSESDVSRLAVWSGESFQQLLHRVGSKWTLDILLSLHAQTLRFKELREAVPGISQRSLSLVTHALERDGLVTRTVFPVIPPRVDYQLTALGSALVGALMPIAKWCDVNMASIEAANERYDADQRAPECEPELQNRTA